MSGAVAHRFSTMSHNVISTFWSFKLLSSPFMCVRLKWLSLQFFCGLFWYPEGMPLQCVTITIQALLEMSSTPSRTVLHWSFIDGPYVENKQSGASGCPLVVRQDRLKARQELLMNIHNKLTSTWSLFPCFRPLTPSHCPLSLNINIIISLLNIKSFNVINI